MYSEDHLSELLHLFTNFRSGNQKTLLGNTLSILGMKVSFVIKGLHLIADQTRIIQPEGGIGGNKVQEGDSLFSHLMFPLDIWNDIYLFYCFQ